MRLPWLLAAACACGHPSGAATRVAPVGPASVRTVPRLPPPPVLDLDAPDAPYRAAMAVQLQPAWAQFLEDCRLRLAAAHPLNELALAATAELAIAPDGQVAIVALATSGNADFDRAVRQVVADASPMPKPPVALWSDDDRLHVRWLFARDRRQAGPATAQVLDQQLPVGDIVARLIQAKDLTRAARRLRHEPAGLARDQAIQRLMVAALADALASSDAAVQRSAIDGIGTAHVGPLAAAVTDLLASTGDGALRLAAIHTLVALGYPPASDVLLDVLKQELHRDKVLTVAAIDALVALGATREVLPLLAQELSFAPAPPTSVFEAFGRVRVPEVDAKLAGWIRDRDVRVRTGACAAAEAVPGSTAWPVIEKGLADRAAVVRERCLDALARHVDRTNQTSLASNVELGRPLTRLLRDRDITVRVAAVRAAAALYPRLHIPKDLDALAADPSPAIRSAAATSQIFFSQAVIDLLDDRDADVRTAAWTALVDRRTSGHGLETVVARGIADPAASVRRVAVRYVDDDKLLTSLAASDDDGDVRQGALARLVFRRGRAASTDLLLESFASGAPGSLDRVRVALAWHLNR